MSHPALARLHARHQKHLTRLVTKHHFAKRFLQAGTLSGLLLLSQPAQPPLPEGTVQKRMARAGYRSESDLARKLITFASLLPDKPGVLAPEHVQQIHDFIEQELGISATQTLDGVSLQHSYGWIGAEQHLKRFPGDHLALHERLLESGMAPGLGAFGYLASSQPALSPDDIIREQYYVAVQTMYTPDWNAHASELKQWYKYRKVLVMNPVNGKAVVADILDAGPAFWTGKQFGGSPELMDYLELTDGKNRGKVLLLFLNTESQSPSVNPTLGPVRHKIGTPELNMT